MNLAGNSVTKKQLQSIEGFAAFATRRKKRLDKEIAGGVAGAMLDTTLCGL